MADRYWVGGTGNWNDTAKWSATSGGAGGSSVPTAADNAYFDGSSDSGAAFTVTLNVTANCKDFIVGDVTTVTALDQAMTLAGSGNNIQCYGSLFWPVSNFTRSFVGNVRFLATTTGNTITLNGKSIAGTVNQPAVEFSGVGGAWTLNSSLNASGTPNVQGAFYAGTLTTNNFNMTVGNIQSLGASAMTLNLGSSTVTTTWDNNQITIQNPNFILNAGTSTINLGNNNGRGLNFGTGLTYHIVKINCDSDGGTTYSGGGACTFNTLEFTSLNFNMLMPPGAHTIGTLRTFLRNSSGYSTLRLQANLTVSTLLDLNTGAAAGRRLYFISNTSGTPYTITAASMTADAVDFRDVTIAGAAAPFNASAKTIGNLLGNSGITFPSSKTVYWNLAGSQNWDAVAWATTSTGTPADANFPLVQDTAVVTEAGGAGTITFNQAWNIGTLTFNDGVSTRTSVVTLAFSSTPSFYGDLKLSSGVIISGTGTATFVGRNTQNITGAGKTFTNGIQLASPGGTLVLQDNLTTATNQTFTLTSGTLNLNGKVPSFGFINFNNSNTRSIIFGTSKIQVSGNNTIVCDCFTLTNFSYTGSGDIEYTYAGSTGTRTIKSSVGVAENNALNFNFIAGTDTVAGFSGNGQVSKNLNFTGFSGTFDYTGGGSTQWEIFGNLTLSANMTFTPRSGSGLVFYSSGTQSIQTNGIAVDAPIAKQNAGTLNLDSNLTMGATRTFTHTQGTVNLNGRVLSTGLWSSSNSNIRNITFGSGQISLTGTGTVWDATTSTSMTITPGTGKIALINNTNTARTFAGGGLQTYPEVEIGGDTGTATTTITGSNRFAKLTNTKTVAYTIVFPNATTAVTEWNLNGSAGNLITLSRTGASGTFTINYAGGQYIVGRYLSISNSTATPINRVYAIYSTDGGGNTNWKFDAPKFGSFLSFFSPPL